MSTQTDISDIASGFAIKAHPDAPPNDDILSIEKLIAAMLSDKHSLSAEELVAFEGLLDEPDMDADTQKELLQALWNIIVCIIDYQWEIASRSTSTDCCGSKPEDDNDSGIGASDMIEYQDHTLSQTHSQAAAGKDRHDSTD